MSYLSLSRTVTNNKQITNKLNKTMWNVLKKSSNKANVETLQSMGFTHSEATHALEAFNNNLEEATNYLLSSQRSNNNNNSASSPSTMMPTSNGAGIMTEAATSSHHVNETEDEQLQRIMAESIQFEENRKAVVAATSSASSEKNRSKKKQTKASSSSSASPSSNVSAASLKAGQAAAARAEMANRRFGANGKIIAKKEERHISSTLKHNIANVEKYRPKETSTSGTNNNTDHSAYSDIKIDTSTLKDHPNVTMPTQMKDKSKEEQIMRCAKRLAPHPHAVDTLLRAFRFIRQNPDNEKYRKIDRSTTGYQNALEGKPGALDLIKAMHFIQRPNSTDLVLHRSQVDVALLYLGESALEEVRKTEEYISRKNMMIFEKELRQIQNGENTKEEEEILKRAAFVSKLPSEPSSGAGALMQVTLGNDTIMRRFDGDDILRDVINFIGGHGSLIPEKIVSREWCLVDLNRYPIAPIDTESDMTKTLQYIGCWPSGRLALKPSPQEWREKREIGEKAGSSRGLGAQL